jgi:hypothetical protein
MPDNGYSTFSSGGHRTHPLKSWHAWIDDTHLYKGHISEHIYIFI